jgi:hypothetical protein
MTNDLKERLAPDELHVPDVDLSSFQKHANGLRRIWSWMMINDLDMQSPESEDPQDTADLIEAQAQAITDLEAELREADDTLRVIAIALAETDAAFFAREIAVIKQQREGIDVALCAAIGGGST